MITNSRVPTVLVPIYAIVCMCCSTFGNWVISVLVPMNLQLSYDLEGLCDLVPWLKISINARSPFSEVTDASKYTGTHYFSSVFFRSPILARRATSLADRLRVSIAVLHGEFRWHFCFKVQSCTKKNAMSSLQCCGSTFIECGFEPTRFSYFYRDSDQGFES